VGFDGSENNDWTALRAETLGGFSFTPRYGPDDRPTIWNPTEWQGRIPRGEVAAAVDEIFDRYQIERMYCDPQDWRSEIGEWALKYGAEHVFEWATNSIKRMCQAIRRFEVDLATGRITHDGCPLTSLAIANARKVAKPAQMYVLGKAKEQQKIDREFVDWLGESSVPFTIVFTKADKLGPVKARQNAERWMKQLESSWEELPPYFITSSEKRMGRDEVLGYIEEINKSIEAR